MFAIYIIMCNVVFVYAKVVQIERSEACFTLPRCSLSYAKVVIIVVFAKKGLFSCPILSLFLMRMAFFFNIFCGFAKSYYIYKLFPKWNKDSANRAQ